MAEETRTEHTACCPSCKRVGTFTFLGEQHWPKAVGDRTGIYINYLWECPNCESTISENSLISAD